MTKPPEFRGLRHFTGVASALLHQLHFTTDAHFIADQYTASLKGGVPVQVPVLAVDLAVYRNAGLGIPPWITGDTTPFNVQLHRLGDTIDGQPALHRPTAVMVHIPGTGGLEGDARMVGDVEEVRALDVLVAVGTAGRYTGRIRPEVDAGLAQVVAFHNDIGAEFPEAAGHAGDHQVFHLELDLAMRGIDGPFGLYCCRCSHVLVELGRGIPCPDLFMMMGGSPPLFSSRDTHRDIHQEDLRAMWSGLQVELVHA